MSSEQPTNNPGTFRPPSFDDNLGADVTSPGTMALGVGQKVFGHFTLKRLLGQGAMGMVWLAHNGNLNREVALKFLPQVLAGDNIVLDELRRETLRCLDLSHHHIVRVYGLELGDAGTGAGGKLAAIHMEFVDGQTLRELMHKRVKEENKPPVFEVREITAWVEQLCDALHYAHTKAKVAHRDLKPSNIMVNSAGEAKLADFGVARKIVDNLAQVTNLIVGTGTTAYMSPQQMNGGVPHPTDDVYSLGATIYELLTSKPPFFSGDMRHQVTQVAAPSMTERREQLGFTGLEEIPEVWERVIAQCLAKNADDRPQSCEEVAKLLKGEAITPAAFSFDKKGPPTQRPARPPAKPQPGAEPSKPFPLVPVSIGVAAVLLLGVGWWWKNRPPSGGGGTAGPTSPVVTNVAPAAAKKPGGIDIQTEPAGATVIVDGAKGGVTPTNFPGLDAGHHNVLIRLSGYMDERKVVTVPEGDVLDVKVTLRRQTGELQVESKPPAAKFTIRSLQPDGAVIEGVTPLKTNLVLGRYAVTMQRPGHPDFTSTNTLEKDVPATLNHEFPEGGLDLKSTPPGVAFEVLRGTNRLFAGVTPTNFSGLPAGSYQVKMSREGFKPFADSVAVTKGGSTPVNWDSTDMRVLGGFAIATEPEGAIATIPDQAPKVTPATFTQLVPGKYTVTFKRDGYEDQTREVTVTGEVATNLPPVKLERATGTLLLASKPPGANYEVTPVSVLGASPADAKGTTKAAPEALKLPTGIYKVTLTRPGWPGFTREEITVVRGASASLSHEFEEGALTVTAQPAGAKFTVNGKPADKFPLTLPPGPVQVIAALTGRPNLTNNLALDKDQQLKHEFVFPASLAITTEPKGAEVKVNGKSFGKASPKLDLGGLPPGEVKIELLAEGYQDRATNLTLAAGEARQLQIKLAKKEAPKVAAKTPEPAPVAPKPVAPKPVEPAPTNPPVQVAKVTPSTTTPPPKPGGMPGAGTKQFKNSLAMEFIAVPGVKGLMCIHETRVQDYEGFTKDTANGWTPVAGQAGNHPAVNITWAQAREYCAWLTDKERKAGTIGSSHTYRLPTDAEWSAAVGLPKETAATPSLRGQSAPKDHTPWGVTKDAPPKGAGNYGPGVGSDDFPTTAPVKSFPPNALGLHDLGGNAMEWCEDTFSTGPGVYALRGGSWKTELIKNVRPPFILMLSGQRNPGAIATDDTGFRLVLDLGQ